MSDQIKIKLINHVTLFIADGVNFLTSDEPLVTIEREPWLSVYPGDEIIKIGSKPRSCFEMKPEHWLQYEGYVKRGEHRQLIFTPMGKDVYYQGLYWYYTFAVVENSRRLYIQTQVNAGRDIEADQITFLDGRMCYPIKNK
jgi:hypothetical protein